MELTDKQKQLLNQVPEKDRPEFVKRLSARTGKASQLVKASNELRQETNEVTARTN